MINWLKNKITLVRGDAIKMDFDSGVGTLSCRKCGHSEDIHLFTHGFGPASHCTMGYQCQSCAKFVTFTSEPMGELGLAKLKSSVSKACCECGGRYARNKPMMCPYCKSISVAYDLEQIT